MRGSIGVMALHGGLEKHTETIAGRIAARTGASLYRVVQPRDLAWHIPSTSYRPDESDGLRSFLSHVRTVVSLHGFGRPHLKRTVLVGGRNTDLGEEVAAAIRRFTDLRVIDDPDGMPKGLAGRHPRNPVNLPELAGVQLELSHSARVAPAVEGVVDALTTVIRGHQASVCPRP